MIFAWESRDRSERARQSRRGWLDVFLLLGIVALAALLSVPWILQSRKTSNEVHAIAALRKVMTSQSIFREGDKEADGNLDYGMLSELSNTSLVDAVLGSGTKQGYLFEASYCWDISGFLWFATAYPAEPTTTGDRYFATTPAGVIYYTTGGVLPVWPGECVHGDLGLVDDGFRYHARPGAVSHGTRTITGLVPVK